MMLSNQAALLFRIRQFAATSSMGLRRGFTMVEMLVVLSVILLLTAVSLPTFKQLLSDQKASRTSRSIVAFFDETRSRSIGDGAFYGVRLHRVDPSSSIDFGSNAVLELSRLRGIPPYTGDASNAVASMSIATTGIATLSFGDSDNPTETTDSQLLTLHAEENAPIRSGDLIELPGGRRFPLEFLPDAAGFPVRATVDLNSPSDGSDTFPSNHIARTASFRYKIFPSPVVSAVGSISMPKGVAVDLSISGVGLTSNSFAATAAGFNEPVDIIFGPDGSVASVSSGSVNTPVPPTGLIYLCLGSSDGISSDGSFEDSEKARSNLIDLNSFWVVINPSSGRVFSSPIASVASSNKPAVGTVITSTTAGNPAAALADARYLALQSESGGAE